MQVRELSLQDLLLILPEVFRDERGFFFESYRESLYLEHGLKAFVQDNVSYSVKNTIRGLHFQSHPGQAKLITCLSGEILDVAVDLRPASPTFMQWEKVLLNDKQGAQLYLPLGFAHGFCVLSDFALLQYKVSAPYNKETEKTIRWDDPQLRIEWPIQNPILSERDRSAPFLQEMRDVVDYR